MEDKLDILINILDNFIHPIDFLQETGYKLLIAIQNYSFNICLITGFLALILYIFGYEKGNRWAFIMPCIYILLNIIIGVLTNA